MAWRLAESLAILRATLMAAYGVEKAKFGTIGDKKHKPPSDHLVDAKGVVAALDVPHSLGLDIKVLAEELRHSQDARIKYVITHGRIFFGGEWKWQPYSGSNPHDKHLHISVKASNYDNNAPWAIGGSMEKITDDEIKILARDLEHVLDVNEGYLNAYRGKTFEGAYRAMSATARHNDILSSIIVNKGDAINVFHALGYEPNENDIAAALGKDWKDWIYNHVLTHPAVKKLVANAARVPELEKQPTEQFQRMADALDRLAAK